MRFAAMVLASGVVLAGCGASHTLGLPYGYADLISNTFSAMTPNPE